MNRLDALAADLRFAFRYFARNRATTAIVVTVLALGTGANALIFSMLQAQFLRPPPAVPSDDALVRIHPMQRATRTAPWRTRGLTWAELLALSSRAETFDEVAGWTAHEVVLDASDSSGARGVEAQFVTPNFFRALGVPLVAGPGFARGTAQGEAAEMTAVVAFAAAELLFDTPTNALGRQILINDVPLRVVGVAPPAFQGAVRNQDEPAVWIPLSARTEVARVPTTWMDSASFQVFARLAPGASQKAAQPVARQIVARALPDSAARVGMARSAWVKDMHAPAPGNDTAEAVLAFSMIGTLGLLILLVACTNVSSLMVAAAVGRRREIAVRLSLGASRARVLRQLLTESTLLSMAGGGLGLLLCWWWLMYFGKTEMEGVDIMPDLGTFAFMLALALGTGLLFGLSPALHATRGVSHALRDSGAGTTQRSRLQRALVVTQIVFSQPLLVLLGATLSLVVADYAPTAPDVSRRVVTVGFRPLSRTGAPGQRREAVDSLVPRIAERPEVAAVTPEAAAFAVRSIILPERSDGASTADTATRTVHVEGAASGWFSILDVPIVLGRDVSLEDTTATDYPIVIGSDLARTLWGNANPIDQALVSPARDEQQDSIRMTVIGVYDATRVTTRGNAVARVYTARGKQWRRDRLLVRTHGPAEPFLTELQRFLRVQAPGLPVTDVRTLEQVNAQERLVTIKVAALAGAGGGVALLLASLGLYGVVALSVQQRRREIGIRIAVGAKPTRVSRMFLASGVRVAAVALVLGLPVSVAALRIGLSQGVIIAPGVNVWLVGFGIAFVLLAVASAATWLPARRAALVDPAITLRAE